MEVQGAFNNKTLVLVSEVIGTAFLMMAMNWSASQDAIPESVGLTVMILTQLFGEISGGHFNPALSFGFLFKEGSAHWARNTAMFIAMMICQGIGAVFGILISTGGFDLT